MELWAHCVKERGAGVPGNYVAIICVEYHYEMSVCLHRPSFSFSTKPNQTSNDFHSYLRSAYKR